MDTELDSTFTTARALGRYELVRPLAQGGMADVYLARRRTAGIDKWLVVKRMRPGTSGDPRSLELFVREARLSMSLAHQNIVSVFDFGKVDDQVFLAMERVEGNDLGSCLARAADHKLTPLLAAFIAAECCQALDYVHRRNGPDGVALGIVHRDVTPRNMLLSWSGEVKLIDFGIAALAGDTTSRLLGTPHYMAPEQARREPIDPRADIYAIGLVLREAVTGMRPRPGDDRHAILDAARRAELVPWPQPSSASSASAPSAPSADDLALGSGDYTPADDAIPPALVAIIERATAALPADRYPDARSMLEDLDSFIVGHRAAHKGESPARQLAAWLAGVWEGVRDAVETESTLQVEQLGSVRDAGALDAIGAGTVRSLVVTADDDGPLAAPAAGSIVQSAAPAVVAEGTGPDPVSPPTLHLVAALDAGARRSPRIAAGSAGPGAVDLRSQLRNRARRNGRQLSAVISAVAAAAVLCLVPTDHRDRRDVAPGAAGQSSAGSPRDQLDPGRPQPGRPDLGQPGLGGAELARPDLGQPGLAALGRSRELRRPEPDPHPAWTTDRRPPDLGQLALGGLGLGLAQPSHIQPNHDQPDAEPAGAGRPDCGHPGPGRPDFGQPACHGRSVLTRAHLTRRTRTASDARHWMSAASPRGHGESF